MQLGLGLTALLMSGCGNSDSSAAGAKKMSFKLTDAGCEPHAAKAPAGPITFEVDNDGTSSHRAGGARRRDDPRREGEHQRRPLRQLLADPGEGPLHPVLPGRHRRSGHPHGDRRRRSRRTSRRTRLPSAGTAHYLETNTRRLVATTAPFVAAVGRGRRRPRPSPSTPPARIPYERIEPVAESFGDLDPDIDARANDVAGQPVRRLPPDREGAVGRRHDARE